MKVLVNNNGVFNWIETPDIKIYKINELKKCTIPPMFLLYENQLFVFSSSEFYDSQEWWHYNSTINTINEISNLIPISIPSYSSISYSPTTKEIHVTGSIEQLRHQYWASYTKQITSDQAR